MLKLNKPVKKNISKRKRDKKRLYFEERESVCVRERERAKERAIDIERQKEKEKERNISEKREELSKEENDGDILKYKLNQTYQDKSQVKVK